MTQVLHSSLPGTLVDFHWDEGTRPRPSYWRINDTSSLRKARVQGPCSGPNTYAQELIFKSISLIARKSRARQIDSELGLLCPAFCIHPLLPSPKQSRPQVGTKKKHQLPSIPVTLQLLTQRPQWPQVCFVMGHLGSCKNVLLNSNIGNICNSKYNIL